MIDQSAPGTWRAALDPDGFCATCRQAVCDHPDALYLEARASGSQGREVARAVPAPTAGQSCFDAGEDGGQPLPAFVPLSPCLHSSTDTPEGQHDHA